MKTIGATITDPADPLRHVYVPNIHPYLVHDLTSDTNWFGRHTVQPRENNEHAIRPAAMRLVLALNNYFKPAARDAYYSIAEPEEGYGGYGTTWLGHVSWSVPKEQVRRPDGAIVAAGHALWVIGQEVVFANERMRDWEIMVWLGLIPADLQDQLAQMTAEQRANRELTAGEVIIHAAETGRTPWLSDFLIDALAAGM